MSLTVANSASKFIWKSTMERAITFAHLKTAGKPSMKKVIWRRIWDCIQVKNHTIAQPRTARSRSQRRVTWTITSLRHISSAALTCSLSKTRHNSNCRFWSYSDKTAPSLSIHSLSLYNQVGQRWLTQEIQARVSLDKAILVMKDATLTMRTWAQALSTHLCLQPSKCRCITRFSWRISTSATTRGEMPPMALDQSSASRAF